MTSLEPKRTVVLVLTMIPGGKTGNLRLDAPLGEMAGLRHIFGDNPALIDKYTYL